MIYLFKLPHECSVFQATVLAISVSENTIALRELLRSTIFVRRSVLEALVVRITNPVMIFAKSVGMQRSNRSYKILCGIPCPSETANDEQEVPEKATPSYLTRFLR